MDIQTVTKRGVASITTTLITSAFITYFLIHRLSFLALEDASKAWVAPGKGRPGFRLMYFKTISALEKTVYSDLECTLVVCIKVPVMYLSELPSLVSNCHLSSTSITLLYLICTYWATFPIIAITCASFRLSGSLRTQSIFTNSLCRNKNRAWWRISIALHWLPIQLLVQLEERLFIPVIHDVALVKMRS